MSPSIGIEPSNLKSVLAREKLLFARRTKKSRALHKRAQLCMPLGVPMPWMASLYGHTPICVASGAGAWFEDIDRNRYLDMNQADSSAALGFVPPPIAEVISRRGKQGTAFLLPVEDGVVAAEMLADLTGVPFWQFTGSASTAIVEAIRIARVATGRNRVLMFEGKYHGHTDEVLVTRGRGREKAELLGLPASIERCARVVTFNDLNELQDALNFGDVACVLTEPLLTNCNLVFPDADFWTEAEKLIRAAGALLIVDEAHTFFLAHGGLARKWNIDADIVVLGKGLGSGIPFGAYGVREPLARIMESKLDTGTCPGLALGGTMFANALALTIARVALECCLTKEAYLRVSELGEQLSSGLEALFARHRLQWRAPHIGGRSGWILYPQLPRSASDAWKSMDALFITTRRIFMANRGVWEAIPTSGPSCSFAHRSEEVNHYLRVADEFLTEMCQTAPAGSENIESVN